MGSRLHWVMMWKGAVSRESMEGGEIQGSDGALKILRVQGREGGGACTGDTTGVGEVRGQEGRSRAMYAGGRVF